MIKVNLMTNTNLYVNAFIMMNTELIWTTGAWRRTKCEHKNTVRQQYTYVDM